MAVKPGDVVSLNLRNRLFFFQGENGINLNEESPAAPIPDEISEANIKQINIALNRGQLVLGSIPEEPVILHNEDEMQNLINGGRNKIVDYVYQLREDSKLSSDDKIQRLEKIMQMEESGKNRGSVIKPVKKALSMLAGHSEVVEEDETEKMEISLIKGNQEEDHE